MSPLNISLLVLYLTGFMGRKSENKASGFDN